MTDLDFERELKKERLKGRYSVLVAIIGAVALMIAAVIGLYQPLQEENSALQVENTESQSEIVELRNRISELENTISVLQESSHQYEDDSVLQAKISALEMENAELKAKISKLEERVSVSTETVSSDSRQGNVNGDNAQVGKILVAWLSEMGDFYHVGDWSSGTDGTDNLNNHYEHVLVFEGKTGSITYKLNKSYNRITGCLYQRYSRRTENNETRCTIYVDGAELWTGAVKGGVEPQIFTLNLEGANELIIECSFAGGSGNDACFGDVALWR